MAKKVNRTDDDIELDDDDAKKLLDVDDDDDDDGDSGDDTADRNKRRDKDDKPDDTDNDGDDDGDPAKLGDPGKRALDHMKRERNAARKELADARAELKKIADKDKSEGQRLQEARDEAATRAAKAEEQWRSMQVAMERAPAHATLAQVKAVAKRVRGESEEDLEADADELFEMLAPAPKEDSSNSRKVAGKPRERMRGGGDPDDEPEETDPRKLADMIRRTKF
jgi:hypothetical protein